MFFSNDTGDTSAAANDGVGGVDKPTCGSMVEAAVSIPFTAHCSHLKALLNGVL